MIIEHLKLERFGGHEKIDFNSNNPVVGVFGVNGSGKSTLLEAVKFAITGETSDKQDVYVKNLEGSACVSLRFRKNGRVGSITRHLGTKKTRKLEWDSQNITAANQVNQMMGEIFGADKKAIANAVFIPQGLMQNLLFCGQAERRDSFVEILNLAFCASRAEVLLRKIQKLQSTIVDLKPSRDAALAQRDTAAEAFLAKKQALEAAYSWEAELAYLNETASARSERQVYQMQLDQTLAEFQIKAAELAGLLEQFGVPSVPVYEQNLATAKIGLNSYVQRLADVQSVQAELTHYDRVSGDISGIYKELSAIQAKVASVDPAGTGLLEWTKRQGILDEEERQAMRRKSLYDQTRQYTEEIARLELTWPLSPGFTSEDVEALVQKARTLSNNLAIFSKNLAMQEEIAACMQSGVLDGKVKCPKCDLTITDANRLSPEELYAMRCNAGAMEQELKTLELERNEKARKLSIFQINHNRTETSIKSCRDLLTKAQAELAQLPVYDSGLIKVEKEKVANIVAVMRATGTENASARGRLNMKLNQRKGYLLAAKHAQNRSEFSSAVSAGLIINRDAAVQQVQTMEGNLQLLKQAEREGARLLKAQGNFTQQVASRDAVLNKAEPCRLAEARQEIPDGAMLWAELNARRRQWVELKAQVVQLEETYTSTNTAFYEIEDRIKKDAVKHELIADLLKLKDLLSNDGLPLSYSRLQFEKLAQLTQSSLVKISADFSIEVDRSRDLAFTFKRLDRDGGVELPMSRLSGGQRARLCVAFLIAVQKHLVSDVGLLVLDEPSTNVDTPGREAIAEFLSGLGKELQNTEMQIWICDHSDEIRRQISCKIEL